MTSDFALEVAKYPQNSPKPQNSERAYCLAPLAMQLVFNGHILGQLSQNLLDQSSPNFQDCGQG